MFGSIGMSELLLIAAIALVFLGPEKFPDFAKIVARTVRDVRSYMQEAQTEIAKELKPVKKELEKLSRYDATEYLEKLADAGGADDEDDGTINNEPESGSVDFGFEDEKSYLTPDELGVEGAQIYESPGAAAEEASEETTGDEKPERLDG